MPYGLTEAGFTAPRGADFLALIRTAYEERTGLTPDWTTDTFLGTITAIMAEQLGGLAELPQVLYDSIDLSAATGIMLDNLSLLVGVRRKEATYSVATVTCTGTAGTIITEGVVVEGGGPLGKSRWASTETATIGGGGTVDILFQAQDAGAVEAAEDELTTIVTVRSGWTSATNAAPATPGTARESNADLRKRRQASLQTAGSRSLNALRANVLAVDGIQACVVLDNVLRVAATVQGVDLEANSLAVVVYPDVLTDAQATALSEVIYAHTPAGIKSCGDETATVTGLDRQPHPVAWFFATTVAVAIAVEVDLTEGYQLDDVEEPIQEAVADYMLALGVGDAARLLQLYAIIAAIEGVDGATVTLNAVAADIVPNLTELLELDGTAVVTEA